MKYKNYLPMNLSESNPVEVSEQCALFVKLYLNLYKLRTSEYIVRLTKTFALEGCLNSRLFENQTFCYLQEATMVGNKKVICKICYKVMESGNLSRHMKKHADISLEDSKPIC